MHGGLIIMFQYMHTHKKKRKWNKWPTGPWRAWNTSDLTDSDAPTQNADQPPRNTKSQVSMNKVFLFDVYVWCDVTWPVCHMLTVTVSQSQNLCLPCFGQSHLAIFPLLQGREWHGWGHLRTRLTCPIPHGVRQGAQIKTVIFIYYVEASFVFFSSDSRWFVSQPQTIDFWKSPQSPTCWRTWFLWPAVWFEWLHFVL